MQVQLKLVLIRHWESLTYSLKQIKKSKQNQKSIISERFAIFDEAQSF